MESGIDRPGDGQLHPVRDLVRSVVASVAPEELPLVEGLRRFDDATVTRRLSRRGKRREPLGFGIGEVAALVTPVVWLVLDGVAQHMVATTVTNASQRVTGMTRRLLRRPASVAVVSALTRDQLVQVRALILAAAQQRGLPAERADELADAVVARLALFDESDAPAPPAPEPPADPGAIGSATGRD
ncbi:hypothetical protein OHA98_20520 [Streptomyces sp. NBC_00654]|uniref:hypothetical protein n=1 Tax=Streptomyces sp. NBC_00654 TaxID=2975799 RepID=UPI0022573FF9|nr:hypothetical protein [Streptomyces sp. NBC_00654]MCX4967130.1 hypothetical protein [Streptomyces sp. NBC_00654]